MGELQSVSFLSSVSAVRVERPSPMRKLSARFTQTLGIALALSVVVCAGQTESSVPGKTAEQVYKNVQVLKSTQADQLISAMQFISASLGVRCDHCHDEHAFDKDD